MKHVANKLLRWIVRINGDSKKERVKNIGTGFRRIEIPQQGAGDTPLSIYNDKGDI